MGLQGVPQAGDIFQSVSNIDKAQDIAYKSVNNKQDRLQCSKLQNVVLNLLDLADIKELLVILKADVQGSVEVLRATLEKLSTEKVKVRVNSLRSWSNY